MFGIKEKRCEKKNPCHFTIVRESKPGLEILSYQVKRHCIRESPNKPVINVPRNTDAFIKCGLKQTNPPFFNQSIKL